MPQFAERTHASERRPRHVANRATQGEPQASRAVGGSNERVAPSSSIRSPVSEVVGGLPAQLRTGVEALSGIAMGDVRVHRNSSEPAKLGALAFARGAEIHLGPGQEQHLPHEAWHVVQQKQGRVQATSQMKGQPLNGDTVLESEADRMGRMALERCNDRTSSPSRELRNLRAAASNDVVQPKLSDMPPIFLGLFAGMDSQGEQILGTYLYGGGEPHDVETPQWTEYMEEHQALRLQILARLLAQVRDIAALQKAGRYPIAEHFHAEFPENSGLSGYALLHGSNKDVGDFLLAGWADVGAPADASSHGFDIEMKLRFVFNDIVDPNPQYFFDRARAVAAKIITFGQPRNYRLSIHWSSTCLAEIRDGHIELSGYPSDRRIGVRPLPQGKLDWVGLEKKQAQEKEVEIVKELERNIPAGHVADLAERKRHLLSLFYGLSGYMAPVYFERLSKRAADDELARLFYSRLSAGLRAELMDALRGKVAVRR